MDPTLILIIDSAKALVLLTAAATLAHALRGRPARIRAVVWGTALVGALLIPAVAPVLPAWSLPLPLTLSGAGAAPDPQPQPTVHLSSPTLSPDSMAAPNIRSPSGEWKR